MSKPKTFIIVFLLFVFFDYIWLGIIMSDFNTRQLSEIGRIEDGVFKINYFAAAATYFLMTLAIQFFILPQLKMNDSSKNVFLKGALLGAIIYGVFDMTNLAILKNYPIAFIAPDIAWGAFVFGVVSIIIFKINIKKAN